MRINWKKTISTFLFAGGIHALPLENLKRADLLATFEQAITSTINGSASSSNGLESAFNDFVAGIQEDAKELKLVAQSIADIINSIIPVNQFHSIEDVFNFLQSIFKNNQSLLDDIAKMAANGLKPGTLLGNIDGFLDGLNSWNNTNSHEPKEKIYPKKGSDNVQYSIGEDQLRSALYIPPQFEYENGNKTPVILVPGTGATGGSTYASNFAKLLKETDYADILYLNVPEYLMDDVQDNAEYVAYAINYISGITNKNVSIISWSQGGLDTQWALKYWPSTRSVVSNFIPISPDFKGTQMAYVICPGYPQIGCNPSVLQQRWESNFIQALNSDGGDSAYVPTTVIYSGTDEIVEPQSGANASAILKDDRGLGVTNSQVQILCPNKPGGSFYTHEGVLYNPIAYALAIDALQNGGPGRPERIDLESQCSKLVPDGLSVSDVIATEAVIVECLLNIIREPKIKTEPPLKSYV